MRKFLVASLFLLSSISSISAYSQSNPAIARAHKTTLHTSQQTATAHALCSATAIGPHAMLTASHCEEATDEIDVEGIPNTLHIEGVLRDGHDHTIYLISGHTFTAYSAVNETDPLTAGEKVFLFGNPGNWADVYREGYVAGRIEHNAFTGSGMEEIAFELPTYYGDSGAAIFSEDGEIVSVVTGSESQGNPDIGTIVMDISFKLAFTPDQILRAMDYGTPVKDK